MKKSAFLQPTLSELKVVARAAVGNHVVLQYENGTISVETGGIVESVAKPVLRQIAADLPMSVMNSNGNPMNTRQLGAALIATLNPGSRAT